MRTGELERLSAGEINYFKEGGLPLELVITAGAMPDYIRMSGVKPEVLIDNVHVDYTNPLGIGADAEVYPGTWLGTPVAVKCLHHLLLEYPPAADVQAFLRTFISECMLHRELPPSARMRRAVFWSDTFS